MINGLDEFKDDNPLMRIVPNSKNNGTNIKGKILIYHHQDGKNPIDKSFEISIFIPSAFPSLLPIVYETGGYIPQEPDYHINWSDGYGDKSMCLGSPIKLILNLNKHKNFNTFINNIVKPFIYAAAVKKEYGIDFVFGGLEHGSSGELDDYLMLMKLKSRKEVLDCLKILTLKKKAARKSDCPCGCGKKLKHCHYRHTVGNLKSKLNQKFSEAAWESYWKRYK